MKTTVIPTKTERFFKEDDIIVSKTDVKGRITYANQSFCHMADYSEAELLGQPHSIIRHPDMPRAVFKLLWDTVLVRREIFAYVKNMSRNGDYYWVFAHVTPSFDAKGNVIGFHSSRRVRNVRLPPNSSGPRRGCRLGVSARRRRRRAPAPRPSPASDQHAQRCRSRRQGGQQGCRRHGPDRNISRKISDIIGVIDEIAR